MPLTPPNPDLYDPRRSGAPRPGLQNTEVNTSGRFDWKGCRGKNENSYFLCGTLLLLLVCSPGWSQTLATSQISGDITDQTGASVPDAQIKLTQTDTGQVHTAKSSATGAYIIPDLPSGPYRLEVALTGFRSYVQTGIVLEVSTNPQINVQLSVGTVDQKVVVQANALMVETESDGSAR